MLKKLISQTSRRYKCTYSNAVSKLAWFHLYIPIIYLSDTVDYDRLRVRIQFGKILFFNFRNSLFQILVFDDSKYDIYAFNYSNFDSFMLFL